MASANPPENFRLRWNDWQHFLSGSFAEFQRAEELFDVTLAAEDGHEVRAHRLLLAACSPFFHNLFKRHGGGKAALFNENMVVYLKGVSRANLEAILEFVYCGEVNVTQDRIAGFLTAAQELSIRGLTSETETPKQNPSPAPGKSVLKKQAKTTREGPPGSVKRARLSKDSNASGGKEKPVNADEEERLRELELDQDFEADTPSPLPVMPVVAESENSNGAVLPEPVTALAQKTPPGGVENVPVTEEMSKGELVTLRVLLRIPPA